jgi:hypothetical protein
MVKTLAVTVGNCLGNSWVTPKGPLLPYWGWAEGGASESIAR